MKSRLELSTAAYVMLVDIYSFLPYNVSCLWYLVLKKDMRMCRTVFDHTQSDVGPLESFELSHNITKK